MIYNIFIFLLCIIGIFAGFYFEFGATTHWSDPKFDPYITAFFGIIFLAPSFSGLYFLVDRVWLAPRKIQRSLDDSRQRLGPQPETDEDMAECFSRFWARELLDYLVVGRNDSQRLMKNDFIARDFPEKSGRVYYDITYIAGGVNWLHERLGTMHLPCYHPQWSANNESVASRYRSEDEAFKRFQAFYVANIEAAYRVMHSGNAPHGPRNPISEAETDEDLGNLRL